MGNCCNHYFDIKKFGNTIVFSIIHIHNETTRACDGKEASLIAAAVKAAYINILSTCL